MNSKFLNLISTLSVFFAALTNLPAGEFIVGADFSHLAFFEDRGIAYKDGGVSSNALAILKSNGLNCVRLRLFTSSTAQAQADPYNYTNNLDYTLPLAVRVKNAGLQFLLDFHYSDSWADPGKQTKPATWTNLTFIQLEQQMYVYNSNTLAAFKAAGALPEYVQIGNEITGGMLWPDGQVSGSYNASWSNLGRLMKAAINGIKDAAGTNAPKIIIHIDRGGDWSTTQWFFDNVVYQNVPFDVIGESYYPWWHGNLDALSNCLSNAAQRYNKPVIVAETAFPWNNTVPASYNPNLGIPLSPAGQVEYTIALASIVKGVPNGQGVGIFWWGAEYVQLSGYNLASFQKTSLFDYGGNALPVLGAYGQLAALRPNYHRPDREQSVAQVAVQRSGNVTPHDNQFCPARVLVTRDQCDSKHRRSLQHYPAPWYRAPLLPIAIKLTLAAFRLPILSAAGPSTFNFQLSTPTP
ncbi:MAG: glycosyl hydrolase 53 family protein [Verrucomicrobiota bacterium]